MDVKNIEWKQIAEMIIYFQANTDSFPKLKAFEIVWAKDGFPLTRNFLSAFTSVKI